MWGKLNQMVSGDQQKIENLESQLETEQQRNKTINDQFKKLLKEKEKEIQRLKNSSSGSENAESNGTTDDREEIREELLKLQRKTEEYEMVNKQKDENIKALMQQVMEAEELKEKVEAQERVNSEKLMFELANRIEQHEKISVKLEEMKHVMEQKDLAVADMADEMSAQEQLIKTNEEVVKKLKKMLQHELTDDIYELLESSGADKEKEILRMRSVIEDFEKVSKKSEDICENKQKDEKITELSRLVEQQEKFIQTLTDEKQVAVNELNKRNSDEQGILLQLKDQNKTIEQMQNLIRNLETESLSLNANLASSANEIEELQKLLVESENKTQDLIEKNSELAQSQNDLLVSLEKVNGKLALRETEVLTFSQKYEHASSESATLRDQLDKLGLELTQELETLDILKNESKTILEEHQNEINRLEMENKLEVERIRQENLKEVKILKNEFQVKLEEISAENDKLKNDDNQQKDKINELETKLHSLEEEKEQVIKEFDSLEYQLSELRTELESKDGSSHILSKQLSNKDENEKRLCNEIRTMKEEIDNSNSVINKLEMTIVQLNKDLEISTSTLNETITSKMEIENNFKTVETNLNDFKAQNSDLSKVVTELEDTIIKLNEDVEFTTKELNHEIKIRKDSETKLLTVQSEFDKLTATNQDLQNNVLAFEESVADLNKKLTSLTNKMQELTKRNEELQERLQKTNTTLSNVTNEKDVLQRTVKDLETLVETLDTEILSSNTKCNEVHDVYNVVKQERDSFEQRVVEIEQVLEDFVRSTESRKLCSEKSSNASGSDSGSIESSPQHLPDSSNAVSPLSMIGSKGFSDVLKILEEERIDIEKQLDTSVTERNRLQGKLEELEASLDLEKEKFENLLKKVDELRILLQEKGDENNKACEVLQADVTSLRLLLQEANDEKTIMAAKQLEMSQTISKLQFELENKNQEIDSLNIHTNKMDEMLKELQSNSLSDKEIMDENMTELKQKNDELDVLINDKVLECERTQALLEQQYQIKNDLENQLKNLQEEIDHLQKQLKDVLDESNSLKEENTAQLMKSHDLTNTLKNKSEELNMLKENFDTILTEKDEDFNNLVLNLQSKEEAVKSLLEKLQNIQDSNENLNEQLDVAANTILNKDEEIQVITDKLRSKEIALRELLEQLENVKELKVTAEKSEVTLKADVSKLSETIKEKEEETSVINANLRSKEESVKLLLDQVEELQKSLSETQQNRLQLDSSVFEKDEQVTKLKKSLEEQGDVIERLKLELSNTEISYQNDLRESEEIYSDLQKQFDLASETEETLQNLLVAKERELETFKTEVDLKASEYAEETSNLKELLLSKDEAVKVLYQKMELSAEMIEEVNMSLERKQNEVQHFQKLVVELEKQLKSSATESQNKLSALNDELHTTKGELEELRKYRLFSSQALTETDEKIQELLGNINQKEEDLKLLSNDVNEHLQEKHEHFKQIEQYQNESQDFKNTISQLQEELQHSLDQSRTVSTQFEVQLKQFEELQQEYGNVVKQLDVLRQNVAQKNEETSMIKENFEQSLVEKDKEVQILTRDLNSKDEAKKILHEQVQMLTTENQQLKSELDRNEAKIRNFDGEVKTLEEKLVNTENDSKTKSVCLEDRNLEFETLKNNHDETRNKLTEVEQVLLQKNEELSLMREDFDNSLIKKDEQFEVLKEEIVSKEESLKVLNEELQQSIAKNQQLVARSDNKIMESNELSATVSILQEKLQVTSNELQIVSTNLQERNEQCLTLTKENKEYSDTIIALQERLLEMEKAVENLKQEQRLISLQHKEEVQQLVASKNETLNILRQQETALRESHTVGDEWNQIIKSKIEEIDILKGEIEDKNNRLSSLNNALQEREENIMILTEKSNSKDNKIQVMQEQIDRLMSETEDLRKALDKGELYRQQTEEELRFLTERNASMEQTLLDKEQELINLSSTLESTSAELDKSLSDLTLVNNQKHEEEKENETNLLKQVDEKTRQMLEFKAKATKKIKELSKELKEKRNRVEELEAVEIKLQNDLMEKKSLLEQTLEKENEIQILATEIKNENVELRKHVAFYEKDTAIVNTQLEESQVKIDTLESSLQELVDEIAVMKTREEGLREDLRSLTTQLHAARDESSCQIRDLSNAVEVEISKNNLLNFALQEKEQQLATFEEQLKQKANNEDSMKEKIDRAVESKSEELRQVIEVLGTKDEKLLQLQEAHDELVKVLDDLKKRFASKDNDAKVLQEKHETVTDDLKNIKEKTARIVKKSQAMKKVISEKEKKIDELNKVVSALETQLTEFQNQSENYKKKCDVLREEYENNHLNASDLQSEIATLRQNINEKNTYIEQLKTRFSRDNQLGVLQPVDEAIILPSDVSIAANAPSETSSTTTLEWDPSITSDFLQTYQDCINMQQQLVETISYSQPDEKVPVEEEVLFTQQEPVEFALPIIASMEDKVDGESICEEKDKEIIALKTLLEDKDKTLFRAKKKIALLKKAEVELAKEIASLQELPAQLRSEGDEIKEQLYAVTEKLDIVENINQELEARNEQLTKLVQLVAEENDDIENVETFLKDIQEFKSAKNQGKSFGSNNEVIELLGKANSDLQDQFSQLQDQYKYKVDEYKMLSEDMNHLIDEKVKHEEVIENLKAEVKKLSILTKDNETFSKKLAEMEEEKQNEITVLKLAREEYEHIKTKAVEEHQKLLDEKFQEEKQNLQKLFDEKEVTYQQQVQIEKQHEIELISERLQEDMGSQLNSLKDQLSNMARELDNTVEKLDNERLNKEQAYKELNIIKDELKITEMQRQQESNASREHEEVLCSAVRKEVKEELSTALANLAETKASLECEKLLKDQYAKEVVAAREELETLQEKDKKQDDFSKQLEQLREHKDLVIKKLKIKLKQVISEKDTLNSSLSEIETEKQHLNTSLTMALETASLVKSKDQVIYKLEQDNNKLKNKIDEIIKDFCEKEELITSLKEESAWLKESMSPLIAKADNAEALKKENCILKQQVFSKDGEITHLKENATLKEHELLYIIDEEKAGCDVMIDEYADRMEKFKLTLEEKDHMLKIANDEIQWLQSQHDDLVLKSEQLDYAAEEIVRLKDTLHEENILKDKYLHKMAETDQKLMDEKNISLNLQEQCNLLEDQVSNLLTEKNEQEHLNCTLSELRELYAGQKTEISQLNDSLKTRENQLEQLKQCLREKESDLEEAQGVLQTKDVELEHLRGEREKYKSIEQNEMVVDDLTEKLDVPERQTVDSQQREKLFETELHQTNVRNNELQMLTSELEERNKILTANIKKREEQIEALNHKIYLLEVQITEEKELNYHKDERLAAFENETLNSSTRTIDELDQIRCLLEGKQAENADLHKKMDELKQEYEESISLLQESVLEKEALYEESVHQIEKVKEMLEGQLSNTSTPIKLFPPVNFQETEILAGLSAVQEDDSVSQLTAEQDASDWDNATDWYDGVFPQTDQPTDQVDSSINVEAINVELTYLRKEVDELKGIKEHKDDVIAKLKLKIKKVLSERKQVEQQLSGSYDNADNKVNLSTLMEENSILKEERKATQETVEHKDTVIAKLKMKLKKTMQARDQLKENLQSEIDRLSQEKDFIFNEFSEKLQQQEGNTGHYKESVNVLTATLKLLEEKVAMKDKEREELKATYEQAAADVEELIIDRDELKSKYAELETANHKLQEQFNIKNELLEKYEWETAEKEEKIREFEKLVETSESLREDWEEERSILEEALKVKDESLEKLRDQHNRLRHKNSRIISEKEVALQQAQAEGNEYAKKIEQLEKQLTTVKTDKEQAVLKADELKSQLEGIEILFGVASSNEVTLMEQLGKFRVESENKARDLERSLKDNEFELGDIKRELTALEHLCKVEVENSVSIPVRIRKLDSYVRSLKDNNDLSDEGLESRIAELTESEMLVKQKLQDFVEENEKTSLELTKIAEKLNDKTVECDDLLEEIQELKEEICDLKEQLDEEKKINVVEEAVIVPQIALQEMQQLEHPTKFYNTQSHSADEIKQLKNTVLSTESRLREKEHEVKMQDENVKRLTDNLNENAKHLADVQARLDEYVNRNDDLKTDEKLSKLELSDLTAEKVHLQKQLKLLMQASDGLQVTAMSEKNKSFLELRDSFDEVITQKDNVIKTLQEKINELRQEHLTLSRATHDVKAAYSEQRADSSRSSNQINDLEKQRDWLKSELDRVINEKNSIGGLIRNQFENISSGLRGDVQLALQDRLAYETEFQLNRLELEKELNATKEQLDKALLALKTKENTIHEKNVVIGDMQNRLEKAAEILSREKYYVNLEERLGDADNMVNQLNRTNQDLQKKLTVLEVQHDNLKLEHNLVVTEKNTMKLESDGKVEEVLLSKAEECQHLRNTFEETMNEKDQILNQLQDRVKNQDQALQQALQSERDTFDSKHAATVQEYEENLSSLQKQLENILFEKEENVKQVALNAVKDKSDQLESLQNDFNALLHVKDEKINALYSQWKSGKQHSIKLQNDIDELNKKLLNQESDITSFRNTIQNLEVENDEISRNKASEIEQVIVKKGKQLKDLRNEFESVFSEKNTIIDNIRNTLKSMRLDMVAAQQKYQESLETNRELEHINTEYETDKIELTSKVDLYSKNIDKLKEELREAKEQIKSQSNNIEDLLAENSKLMTEYGNMMNEIMSLKERLNLTSTDKKEITTKDSEQLSETDFVKTQLSQSPVNRENAGSMISDLKAQNVEQQVTMRTLQNSIDDFKAELLMRDNALTTLDDVMSNIPSVQIQPNQDVITKARQLVASVTALQKYNNDLSMKVYDLSEERQNNTDVESLKRHVESLQKELVTMTTEKESLEDVIREKYEDILSNLRGDLLSAREGNTALHEENFALQHQLHVYTNVDAKRLRPSSSTPSVRPQLGLDIPKTSMLSNSLQHAGSNDSFLEQSFDLSPIKDDVRLEFIETVHQENLSTSALPQPTPPVIELIQASVVHDLEAATSETSDKSTKEHIDLKRASVKLKKLCRKYKDEAQLYKTENEHLNTKMTSVAAQNEDLLESLKQLKLKYERGMKDLRDEINVLVDGKSTVIETLKARHVTEMKSQAEKFEKLKTTLENEISKITDKNRDLKNDILFKNQTMEHQQQYIEQLKEEHQALILKMDTLQNNISQVENRAQVFQNLIQEQEASLSAAGKHYEEKCFELVQSQHQIDVMTEQLLPKNVHSVEVENMRFDEDEVRMHKKALIDQEEALMLAKDEIEKLRSDNKAVAESLLEAEERCRCLEDQKSECEAHVSSLREELSNFVQEKEFISAQWKDKVQNIIQEKESAEDILKKDFDIVSEELSYAQNEIANLNDYLVDYQERLVLSEANMEREVATGQRLLEDLNDVAREREQLRNKVKADELEIITLQKHLSSIKNNNISLRDINNEKETLLEGNLKKLTAFEEQASNDRRMIDALEMECNSLKTEKEELEVCLRREVEQTFEEMAAQKNRLRDEVFTKEKSIQELRRELDTVVREKEFLTSAMRGQLTTREQSSADVEHLRFRVQQMQREKDESSETFDRFSADLKTKLDENVQEKAALELRMAILRGMLEQEVKDHEKTKFIRQQLSQTRGVAVDRLKSGVSGMKNNIRSLKQDIEINLSGMKHAFEETVMNIAPSLLKSQLNQNTMSTVSTKNMERENDVLKEQVSNKALETDRLQRRLQDADSAKRLAEARLRDLVGVLEELGAIKTVQEKLLQRESSVAALHNTSNRHLSELEEMRKSLEEKDLFLHQSEEARNVLEDTVKEWREKCYELENQLKSPSLSDLEQTGLPKSEQSELETFLLPRIPAPPEPATPKMTRN